MIVPAYTPGGWWVAVADGGCVVLPGEVDASTLVAVWTDLREGAGLTELLTDLLRPGIAAVPPFALVDVEGRTVHAVVRGDVVVEVTTGEGVRTITGSRMTTWAEAVLGDARRIVVRTPGAEAADLSAAVPLLSGVVQAGAVVVDLSAVAGSAAHPPLAVVPAAEHRPAPAPAASPMLSVVPAELEREVRAPQDEVVPSWAPVRPIRSENLGQPGHPEHPEPPAEQPRELSAPEHAEHLDAGTAPLPLGRLMAGPASERRPVASPPGGPAEREILGPHEDDDGGQGQDHDGLTVLSSDVVALRRQLPEWAGDAVPSIAVPTPRNPAPSKLVLSTGLVVSLNRPVLLGRAPQVTRVSNNEIPRLVTLASPNQDISRTHAEVRMDGEDVVVTDLRSTNGVLLLRQGSGPQRLHPGEPTVVEPGVVVDLGEGATFLVEAGG